MKPQPKPVTGAIFGLFLGAVIVALLWQLGILPPDRLVVFGIVAIVMLVSTFALTQRVSLVRKRFVVVVVFAALLGGISLTGIPEFVAGGSITEGCTIEASSSLSGRTSPSETSATSPFRAALTDDVPWVATTDTLLTSGTNAVGIAIAGFEIPLSSGAAANTAGVQEVTGVANVAELQSQLQDASGLELTGAYQVFGYTHATEGDCDTVAYVSVAPVSAFGTPILIGLWVLAVILFIVIVALGIGVRRSIRTSQRLEATTPPGGADATTTNAPYTPQQAAPTQAPPQAFTPQEATPAQAPSQATPPQATPASATEATPPATAPAPIVGNNPAEGQGTTGAPQREVP